MTKILLHHHLGLGDHIICNGLVRYLSINNHIDLFCKNHNLDNIKLMYKDNKNINIIDIHDDSEAEHIGKSNKNYIKLGIALNNNYPKNMEISWDKIFYYQIGVDFDHSWSSFKYNKSTLQNPVPTKPFVFLCSTGSDGIDRLDYTKIDHSLQKTYSNNGNFFDNINLIQNATEIHCINSAYIHLIDRIDISDSTKLVFHKNFMRKNYSDFTLKKNWTIL